MTRLFTGGREIAFMNDIVKEFMKDVIGQKIYLYNISNFKTAKSSQVYEESPDKIFEDPIEVEALVKWNPTEVKTNNFNTEYKRKISVYIHSRDMIQKEIEVEEGDFFSYGPEFFEVTSVIAENMIHGQVEYKLGLKIEGIQARKSQFSTKVFGPTEEKYSDPDAIQETFVQQRGFAENRLGETNDTRDLQKDGVLDAPISPPAEVSDRGNALTSSPSKRSSFYGDGD